MTRTQVIRVACLAEGDASPPVPAALQNLPRVTCHARTLDAFLAELDAGGELPDAVVAFGGERLIRALRNHDRSCAVAAFLIAGQGLAAPPGWDGVWDGSGLDWGKDLVRRAEWTRSLAALRALLDSERREHRFARWVAARGKASCSDAEVFSLDAPRSCFRAWRDAGWVVPAGSGAEAWLAQPSLRTAAAQANLSQLAPAAPDEPATRVVLAPPGPVPRGKMIVASVAALTVLGVFAWRAGGFFAQRDTRATDPGRLTLRVGEPAARQSPLQPAPVLARSSPDPEPDPPPSVREGPRLLVPFAGPPVVPPVDAPLTLTVPPPAAEPELVAPLPLRLIAQGTLRREERILRSPGSGTVEVLLAVPGERCLAGAPLVRLVDAAAALEAERLAAELARLDEAIGAFAGDDANALQGAEQAASTERARLARELTERETEVAEAQRRYDRNLRLAEEGVIAFREVRPDWDGLQRAGDRAAAARDSLDSFLAAGAEPAAAGGEPPAWLVVRRLRLEDELRATLAKASPRSVRALEDSELLAWSVAAGDEIAEGGELARVSAGEAWIEALLEPHDAAAGSLIALEIRLQSAGPWTALMEFEQVLLPGGGTLLRARLPASLVGGTRGGATAELRFLLAPR
jgi:multidrug efflux pump subunit AcrA (membrane-fusion protein)